MDSIPQGSESFKRKNPALFPRQEGAQVVAGITVGSDQSEEDLHNEILSECKNRGWIALHGSMAHRTFRTEGEPDFVILADNGQVFFVEAKTKIGKLSMQQQGLIRWAALLGHQICIARSIEEFRAIVTPK